MKYTPKEDFENVNVSSEHPLKEFAHVLLGIGLIIVVPLMLLIVSANWLLEQLPPSTETKLFSRLYDSNQLGEVAPQELKRVYEKLRSADSSFPYELELVVICEKQSNAFAIPGGVIGVTSGILDLLETENGLAMVLAHEMGHFQNRHHLKGLARSVVLAMASLFLGSTTFDFISILGLSFNRDQELESDTYALNLMRNVYGHVAGAEEFFQKMKDKEGVLGRLPSFLSTHPGTDSRIEHIRRQSSKGSMSHVTPLKIPNPCVS